MEIGPRNHWLDISNGFTVSSTWHARYAIKPWTWTQMSFWLPMASRASWSRRSLPRCPANMLAQASLQLQGWWPNCNNRETCIIYQLHVWHIRYIIYIYIYIYILSVEVAPSVLKFTEHLTWKKKVAASYNWSRFARPMFLSAFWISEHWFWLAVGWS